jgi:hypothetical protein
MAAWFPIAAGLFSIVCSVTNARFFMNHRKARFMIRVMGATGARVLLLGLFLACMGTPLLLGMVPSR